MYLDPKAEFAQIFNEGWRNQRNYLYVPNLHGTDWPKMKAMYGPLLPYVMHRADLNYLLDMMGAEIAIGHSYVRGGDMPEVPSPPGGLLGADFAVEDGRYRIRRSTTGRAGTRPACAAVGAGRRRHRRRLHPRGQRRRAARPTALPAARGHGQPADGAHRRTARPTIEGARQVTVVPVANEQGCAPAPGSRGTAASWTHSRTGQLAYVYLPNTGQPGYPSFNRYYFAQQDRKGVIVDERFNGGGSAADYIIDVLQRDFDGYFNRRVEDHGPFTSPAAGIWGRR